MQNPYESPQVTSDRPRRWLMVTVILFLWCVSAAIGGFLLGMTVYFLIPGFAPLRQSPWWQVAGTFAIGGIVLALPIGWQRTARLNRKLHDIHHRRQELLDQLRKSGRE
ncbi:MAG: hypothetical protein SFX18_01870 [Pirellulales bacterium]|nr:hypothetical protein [Pirellulales bacterium]